MYRVTVAFTDGGFSQTSHPTAIDAFSKIVKLRQAGGKVIVEDANSVIVTDNQLVALMAKEAVK